MSKNIDIELIIAYINDDIADSQKREEIRYNIENDSHWFSAYLDLKTSIVEMESTDFEVTPDELLNPSTTVSAEPSKKPLFDFAWLLKPQMAMGAACMLIVVIFISLSSEGDSGLLVPQTFSDSTDMPMVPQTFSDSTGMPSIKMSDKTPTQKRGISMMKSNNFVTISVNKENLTVSNNGPDILTILVNDRNFSLSMFDSLDIQLENGDNKVVVVNSKMDTIQDTTITVNE